MTFKRKQVIMLPTDQKAEVGMLTLGKNSNILRVILAEWMEHLSSDRADGSLINQHLYILSDEKIADGDWCMSINKNSKLHKPFRCVNDGSGFVNPAFLNSEDCKDIKKIIATTDRSLNCCPNSKIALGCCNKPNSCSVPQNIIPQPSAAFISKYAKKYNKGNMITEVMVEYDDKTLELQEAINDLKNRCLKTYSASKVYNYYNSLNKLFAELKDHKPTLKVDSKSNTIITKKVKNAWTLEEVLALHKLNCERLTNAYTSADIEWIESKL